MTCHALACPRPALPGAQQCREHWLMLPAAVRAKKPWVDAVAHNHNRIPSARSMGGDAKRGPARLEVAAIPGARPQAHWGGQSESTTTCRSLKAPTPDESTRQLIGEHSAPARGQMELFA